LAKEAILYEKREEGQVQCFLCAHRCLIAEGRRGVCMVRENEGGTLYTHTYGRLIAQAVDPIEKKPLYHFRPGTSSYSIATVGCNFQCRFCQNADISQQVRAEQMVAGPYVPPESVVETAKRRGCATIAYTYTEPTIFFEYAYDVFRPAVDAGMENIFVTNGYMTPETIETAKPYLHAANVDLKSFRDDFYKRLISARLAPVLESLRLLKRAGVWVEVTTLLIPTLNDSDEELREIARFIRDELGVDTPWHVSRFYPAYRLQDVPPTPVTRVREAREIGLAEGLRYVYEGNVPDSAGAHTYCYNCGEALIRRAGYHIIENRITGDQRCPRCQAEIDGVGLPGPREGKR
jgi:pyruvate formate lyase activating enzyme